MDQVVLDGKTYIPSKRAAQEFGYTQDYVGQLCRGGSIDAKRVSGQWYIFPESLQAYKAKAETFKPEPPKYQPDPNVEATLNVEGKEYISAALAAKITEYNQDYVGQLARAGKIPSRQIGNRWYVDREAILTHKKEKDALLRAVQAESVGLKKPETQISHAHAQISIRKPEVALMTYQKEDKPLFPEFQAAPEIQENPAHSEISSYSAPQTGAEASRIPIRVMQQRPLPRLEPVLTAAHTVDLKKAHSKPVSIPGKSIFQAILPGLAFSFAIVLAVGLGVYKRDLIYSTVFNQAPSAQSATAATPSTAEGLMHRLLSKEIVYIRSN